MILISFSFLIFWTLPFKPRPCCQVSGERHCGDWRRRGGKAAAPVHGFFFATAGSHTFAARRVLGSPQLWHYDRLRLFDCRFSRPGIEAAVKAPSIFHNAERALYHVQPHAKRKPGQDGFGHEETQVVRGALSTWLFNACCQATARPEALFCAWTSAKSYFMEASKREGPGGGRGCHESVLRPVPCQPTNTSLKETPAKEDNAADKFCSHCRFVPAFAMRLHRRTCHHWGQRGRHPTVEVVPGVYTRVCGQAAEGCSLGMGA